MGCKIVVWLGNQTGLKQQVIEMKMNVSGMSYKAVEKSVGGSIDKLAGFACVGGQVFVELAQPVESSIQFVSFA